MVGTDCVVFNRAFARAGLARHMLRLSVASEENTLLGIGARNAENFYFTAGYLVGLDTPGNQAFLDRYHAAFGQVAPMPNTIGQSCYEGIRLYAELARRAGSLGVAALSRVSEGLAYTGARGRVTMRVAPSAVGHLPRRGRRAYLPHPGAFSGAGGVSHRGCASSTGVSCPTRGVGKTLDSVTF